MRKRFLIATMALLAVLSLPGGFVFALNLSGSLGRDALDLGVRSSNHSPRASIPLFDDNPPAGAASTLAVTATATRTATATGTATAVSTRPSGASAGPTGTATPTASPAATVTVTATAAASSTATPTATPSVTATATVMPSATISPTVSPTPTAAAKVITTTRSFRFQGVIETRREGSINATESFAGEKAGEDYRFNGTYRDGEGTVNVAEYVLAGGKLYARSASKVAGQVVGPPIGEASWREVDATNASVMPKELFDAFAKAAQTAPLAQTGAPPDVEVIDFDSNGRFSSGTAQVERATGRLAKVEARQELAVSPSVSMVISATMSLSGFDAPLSISAPAIEAGTDITDTATFR